MRAAHRAEVGDLGRLLGQGFIVETARLVRVKTNVDNSANENGAHGRACVSLTADKSIQSDSQLDKYGSDKINGNIRGSVSDCVAACTKEPSWGSAAAARTAGISAVTML